MESINILKYIECMNRYSSDLNTATTSFMEVHYPGLHDRDELVGQLIDSVGKFLKREHINY